MRETIQNANGKQFHAVSLSGGKDSNIPIGLSHSFHKGLNGFKLKICKRDPHIYPSNSL